MNLKIHLLLQITGIATACLFATGTYVLFQVNREVHVNAMVTLDAAEKYLNAQLWGINPDVQKSSYFPNFDLWRELNVSSGTCLQYAHIDSAKPTYSSCQGEERPNKQWPESFEIIYQSIFSTGNELSRPVTFRGRNIGTITLIPGNAHELTKAWHSIKGLLGLAAGTTLAVCAWVYIAIQRALRPAQIIVDSLAQIQLTESQITLPVFELKEWQQIGSAINQFADTQKQLLFDRQKLLLQLMTLQQEERAFLARELHDDLGQCLTGLNALTASILQTAQQDCPQLVANTESIVRVNRRMMEAIRTLLLRLRSAELEELGLNENLRAMTEEWNMQHKGRIVCRLCLTEGSSLLKSPLSTTLFRIAQEGLTNIAKHANATEAVITLETRQTDLFLTIEDNGNLESLSFSTTPGLGLLGISERVKELHGSFRLSKSLLGGLQLQVTLPRWNGEVKPNEE